MRLIGEFHFGSGRYLYLESRPGLHGDQWYRLLEPDELLPQKFHYRLIGSETWVSIYSYPGIVPGNPPCHQQAGHVYCVECENPSHSKVTTENTEARR